MARTVLRPQSTRYLQGARRSLPPQVVAVGQVLETETSRAELAGYLKLDGTTGCYAKTPDDASLDITGDIDVRVALEPSTWSAQRSIISKWVTTGNQRSYRLRTLATGVLNWVTTTNGTGGGVSINSATVPAGTRAVRVTHDVDNGASQNVVRFYTGPRLEGPWTQLGTDATTAGVTSLFSGTAPLELGAVADGTLELLVGNIYAAELRNGIDGTVVANPDFRPLARGTTSFTDGAGKSWSVLGTAFVEGFSYPFPQAIETETATVTTVRRTFTLGQAVETETAQTITRATGQTVVVNQAIETETATAMTVRKTVTLGQVVETETGTATTVRKTVTAGQVTETETATVTRVIKTRATAQAVETETATITGRSKVYLAVQALETELAQTITRPGAVHAVGQVVETETSQAITRQKVLIVGQVVETETAQTILPGYLKLDGTTGCYAKTPDHASLDITGDIDVRVALDPATWTAQRSIISKYVTTGNQRSYRLRTLGTGVLQWVTTTDGISGAGGSSTVAVSAGTRAVRVTHDVDNGSSQNVVRFYTADQIEGPWTQLGTDVVNAGTTSIFSGTAPLELGAVADGTLELLIGKIFAAEVRDGINGTIVANPDFRPLYTGTTSFNDSTGKTWSILGSAVVEGQTPLVIPVVPDDLILLSVTDPLTLVAQTPSALVAASLPQALTVISTPLLLTSIKPAFLEVPAPIAGQGYRLVFSDDFDTLDHTIWTNMPWYTWKPEAYSVADSVLTITPPDGASELTSLGPRAGSAPHYPNAKAFHEGYFEARISWTPMDQKFTPAYWLWGIDRANQHPDYICTPPTLQPEWDFMEIFQVQDPPGTFHAGLHSNTLSPCGVTDVVSQQWTAGVNMTGWHVYGGLWANGKLRSYVDGVQVAMFDVPSSFTQQMCLVLSQSYEYIGAHTFVDWVRVWQQS